jgi:hypothetical protein
MAKSILLQHLIWSMITLKKMFLLTIPTYGQQKMQQPHRPESVICTSTPTQNHNRNKINTKPRVMEHKPLALNYMRSTIESNATTYSPKRASSLAVASVRGNNNLVLGMNKTSRHLHLLARVAAATDTLALPLLLLLRYHICPHMSSKLLPTTLSPYIANALSRVTACTKRDTSNEKTQI